MIAALRRRRLTTYDVSSRVRLTRTPAEYLALRSGRRELVYEAMLAGGRTSWTTGERTRIYRTRAGVAALVAERDDDATTDIADPRDYDVDHYEHVLRTAFAARLARAFTPDDFAAVFAGVDQLLLFAPALESVQPILTRM
jgi:DNA polymerase I